MDIACIYFTPFWVNLMDDLQKTSCHNLKNEWNWVPSNVPEPLAYAHINLSAFGSIIIHFPSEKLILPYISSCRGVTTSVPFLEVRIKKGLSAVYGLSRMIRGLNGWSAKLCQIIRSFLIVGMISYPLHIWSTALMDGEDDQWSSARWSEDRSSLHIG